MLTTHKLIALAFALLFVALDANAQPSSTLGPPKCTIAAGSRRVFSEGGTCGSAVHGAPVILTDASSASDCGVNGSPTGSVGGGTIPSLCAYRSSLAKLVPLGGGAGGGGGIASVSADTAPSLGGNLAATNKTITGTAAIAMGPATFTSINVPAVSGQGSIWTYRENPDTGTRYIQMGVPASVDLAADFDCTFDIFGKMSAACSYHPPLVSPGSGVPSTNEVPIYSTTTQLQGVGNVAALTYNTATGVMGGPKVIGVTEQASAPASTAGIGKFWVANVTPDVLHFLDDAGTDSLVQMTSATGVTNGIKVLGITEQASAPSSVAGILNLWVKDSTPNMLRFTDDAGTTFGMLRWNIAGTAFSFYDVPMVDPTAATGSSVMVPSGLSFLVTAPQTLMLKNASGNTSLRMYEDSDDLTPNYSGFISAPLSSTLTGNQSTPIGSLARSTTAALGGRGPVIGAVSDLSTTNIRSTGQKLCDATYNTTQPSNTAVLGVTTACVVGTTKSFAPSTAVAAWVTDCTTTVPDGTYFEVVCTVW